jgi:predicted negative regulator of RcsB-dependent stress response
VDELSEQEQWERLKGWVRSNGPQVVILVALMLFGWYGWKWWQSRGEEKTLAAETAYESILQKFDAEKEPEALAQIETLRSEYPKSPYVGAADMVAAKVFVESNQLDKAAERLQRVATTTTDEKLRPIARVRLARVQSAQGKYDIALATLGEKPAGANAAGWLDARGDILFAKNDRAGALAAYEEAVKLQPPGEQANGEGGTVELLQLKIADLKGSAVAPPPVPEVPAKPVAPAKPAAAPAAGKP